MKSLTNSFSHLYNGIEVAGHEGAWLNVPSPDFRYFRGRREGCPIALLESIMQYRQSFLVNSAGALTENNRDSLHGGTPLEYPDATEPWALP